MMDKQGSWARQPIFYRFIRKTISSVLLMGLANLSYGTAAHPCSEQAKTQARKLLAFHFGADERIEIEDTVKVLPSLNNPANSKQQFDVLEIWGHIYKGQYRMHLIYAQIPKECVLMGQEVLEYADL